MCELICSCLLKKVKRQAECSCYLSNFFYLKSAWYVLFSLVWLNLHEIVRILTEKLRDNYARVSNFFVFHSLFSLFGSKLKICAKFQPIAVSNPTGSRFHVSDGWSAVKKKQNDILFFRFPYRDLEKIQSIEYISVIYTPSDLMNV